MKTFHYSFRPAHANGPIMAHATGAPPTSPLLLTCRPTGARLHRARAMLAVRSPPPPRIATAPPPLSLLLLACTPIFSPFLHPGSNAAERSPPRHPSLSCPPGQVWARRGLPPHPPDAVHRPRAREVLVHRRICADEPHPPRVTPHRVLTLPSVLSSPHSCSRCLGHSTSSIGTSL
jgi:hypothetical protein